MRVWLCVCDVFIFYPVSLHRISGSMVWCFWCFRKILRHPVFKSCIFVSLFLLILWDNTFLLRGLHCVPDDFLALLARSPLPSPLFPSTSFFLSFPAVCLPSYNVSLILLWDNSLLIKKDYGFWDLKWP